jgi:hypothetical protein
MDESPFIASSPLQHCPLIQCETFECIRMEVRLLLDLQFESYEWFLFDSADEELAIFNP